jgi:putative endonuclease
LANTTQVKPWFLYLVQNVQNSLYTGITLDVARRFAEHQAQSTKTAKALKGKAPLRLMYAAQLQSHGDALRAEIWVKKQPKKTKLALIAGAQALPFEHAVQKLPLTNH